MITLKHDQLSLTIAPEYGSNMTSLKVGDDELIFCKKALLNNHDFTGNFVLWPLPNRVKNRSYYFNNKPYSLKKVVTPRGNYHLIHGLVRDASWQYKVSQNKIKTWIDTDPNFQYWSEFPWLSKLTLTYILLKNAVRIEYQVDNLDKKPLAFGFALHPLFKQAMAIQVPAKHVMEADDDLLPNGKLLPANLNSLTPVKNLELDDVFTGLTGPQIIKFKNGKILKVTFSNDFTHCVVYTKEKNHFICVESQTCATDAHNLTANGHRKVAHLITLAAGETHKGWLKYEIN